MVGREEAAMALLVLIMGFFLLLLLIIPSSSFVWGVESVVRVASWALSPTSTTTSTTSSTTTTLRTTTTNPPTTTASTSTTSTSSTSTTSSTTTTMSGRRCDSLMDCGGPKSEMKCKKGVVYNYTTVYTSCQDAGTPTSYCLGKVKEAPVISCEEWEQCMEGRCVSVYDNECDLRCDEAGYALYYCGDECSESDVEVGLKGECSRFGVVCCCISGGD